MQHHAPLNLNSAQEINLDRLSLHGVEIVKDVSRQILELISSGKLVDEQVIIPGFTPDKPVIRTKTNADRISDQLIRELLQDMLPEVGILSEYTRVRGFGRTTDIPKGTPYAVVDPIDGTIHLQKNDGQWTINLAFCVDGESLVGIVAVPAENKVYVGVRDRPSVVFPLSGHSVTLLEQPHRRQGLVFGIYSELDLGGDLKYQEPYRKIAALNGATETPIFGSAYSYLKVADGTLDAIVNLGGNFHWDKAAAQVIIEGCGARIVSIDWSRDTYSIVDEPSCLYNLDTFKDDGHIVARTDLTLKIDTTLRNDWNRFISPAFK